MNPLRSRIAGTAAQQPAPIEVPASSRAEARRSRVATDATAQYRDEGRLAAARTVKAARAALGRWRRAPRAELKALARRQLERAKRVARRVRDVARGARLPAEPSRPPAPAPAPAPALVVRAIVPVPWGEPLITCVLDRAVVDPAGRAAVLAKLAGQTLDAVEIVEVDRSTRRAWRLGLDGIPVETWALPGRGSLRETALGKYVCLLSPSFVHVPDTYLEVNALALEGHDLDFAVNGFGPRPLLEGALAEGRLPDVSLGRAEGPLLVFRAECLDDSGTTFDPTRLEAFGRPQARVVGRAVLHERGAECPFASPAEWRGRLVVPGLASNGTELLLTGGGTPPVLPIRKLEEAVPYARVSPSGRPRVLVSFPFLAVGGAEKLTWDVLERLRARFDFVVITSEPGDASVGSTAAEFRRATPFVYTLPDCVTPQLTTSVACYLTRKFGAETLFVPNGSSWFYDTLEEMKARFPRLRIVNQVFDHNYGWINRYDSAVAALVDTHVAPNRAIADAYRARGVPEGRVHLIHHGIDVSDFDPAGYDDVRRTALRRQFGLPEGRRIVSFIARVHPQKRPTDFLRLAERFRDDAGYAFLMVGDGPASREVDAMAAQLALPNLVRLPFHQPVQDVMAVTDVLVIPSEYEGLPLVLLDCLAMGIPAVATDVGCIGDVLTPETGVLVRKIGDVRALEGGVRSLAEGGISADVRARARAIVVEGFDIARAAEQYARALEGKGA